MLREKSSTFQSTGRKRITSLIQNQAHTNWYVCPCLSVRRACVFLYQFPLRTQVESQNRNMYGSKVNAPVPKPMKPTKFPVASVLCCELCIHATQSKHFYTMSSSSTSWVLFSSLDSPCHFCRIRLSSVCVRVFFSPSYGALTSGVAVHFRWELEVVCSNVCVSSQFGKELNSVVSHFFDAQAPPHHDTIVDSFVGTALAITSYNWFLVSGWTLAFLFYDQSELNASFATKWLHFLRRMADEFRQEIKKCEKTLTDVDRRSSFTEHSHAVVPLLHILFLIAFNWMKLHSLELTHNVENVNT